METRRPVERPTNGTTAGGFTALPEQFAELRGHVQEYLAASVDQVRDQARAAMRRLAAGLLALIAAMAVAVTAVGLALSGLAGAISALAGDRQWVGNLIVGGVILIAIALGLRTAFKPKTVTRVETRRKPDVRRRPAAQPADH